MNAGIGDGDYFRKWYLSRDWRFYRPFLAEVLQRAEPGPILDVGAGLGYLVEAAQRWGLVCHGIEGSPEAVEMGRHRYDGLNVRHHRLSDRFPFEDSMFSVAVFNQVIEHLEPAVGKSALSEIHRVLKPGGMLLLYSPSRYNEKERLEDPTHICMYSPSQLRRLATDSGFVAIEALDEPLALLGNTRLGRRAMTKIFKLAPLDRFSASANLRAFKATSAAK